MMVVGFAQFVNGDMENIKIKTKRKRPKGVKKTCLQCHIDIIDTTNHRQQKYCSKKCMSIANLKNPVSVPRQCNNCGSSFEDKTKGKNKRFCNYQCKTNYLPNRIKHSLRSRLNSALRNSNKTASAARDLGCTFEDFKKHIEDQWLDGMTWETYGKTGWTMDHIKPLDAFDLADPVELKKAIHYTNLQPLWAKENSSKGARYDYNK